MRGEFQKFFAEGQEDQTINWVPKQSSDDQVDYGADPNVVTPQSLGLEPDSVAWHITNLVNDHKAKSKEERRQRMLKQASASTVNPASTPIPSQQPQVPSSGIGSWLKNPFSFRKNTA